MQEKLLKLLNGVGTPKVLLIGDFMLDNYLYGNTDRISPEAPVVVLNVTEREERPGGAGSVAMDLLALEAKVACLGVVGDDPAGLRLKELLSEMGSSVCVEGLLNAPNRPTTVKQRIIGLAQHRHRQQLMRIDQESSTALAAEVQRVLAERFAAYLDWCDVVCFEDYNKGVLADGFSQELIGLARKRDKAVLIDPALVGVFSRYEGAWLVKPNRRELAHATGRDVTDDNDLTQATQELMASHGIENMVVTMDKRGAFLCTRQHGRFETQMVPTRPRNVYDVTGAGDMVLATLTLLAGGQDAETRGANLPDMVRLANIAGGLEVERFGAVGITRDEIRTEFVRQGRDQISKLRSLEALCLELQWARQQDHRIVFTNGCFDLLHPGHISLLSFAKAQGDLLIVAINSDASVRNLKGPQRPILRQEDRAAILSALEAVDYVLIFDEPTPIRLIEATAPDILIKGSDWTGNVVGQEFVESRGGKVVLMPLSAGFSTTNIIAKVIETNGLGKSSSVKSNE